jgi:ribosomal-protein-alanine N-acetyltransferase
LRRARTSARVYLRPPTARDRAELLAAFRRSRRLHANWVRPLRSAADFARYLRRATRQRKTHAGFLVCRIADDAIVGAINVSEIVRGAFQSAYLGYCGFVPHVGQGYMSEGMRLLLRHAFTKMKLHRLEANIQPGNVRSIALAKRCGFRLEGFSPRYLKIAGRWRDHERWAISLSLLGRGQG